MISYLWRYNVLSYDTFVRKYESTFESTFVLESTTLYFRTKVRKYFRTFVVVRVQRYCMYVYYVAVITFEGTTYFRTKVRKYLKVPS